MTRARGPGRPPGVDGAETRAHPAVRAAVFSDHGFDRASLKATAEAAGLTRHAIANYLPGTAELRAAAFGG